MFDEDERNRIDSEVASLYYSGLSCREIAKKMGGSWQTIQRRLHRLKVKMRTKKETAYNHIRNGKGFIHGGGNIRVNEG